MHVLDWCVACTGLVCCMYWTGVLHVLDWCVAKVHQIISGGSEEGSCVEASGHEHIPT